ncbi:MAG: PRC-barrel domain-containing protein [Nitrospirota bacterium]
MTLPKTAGPEQKQGAVRSVRDLYGYAVRAEDGDVGNVEDLLFDDLSWKVRYLVVDLGRRISGKKILIAPGAFGTPDWEHEVFPVSLTRQQAEQGPGIDADRPVSRQGVRAFPDYSGREPAWSTLVYGKAGTARPEGERKDDLHLRSTKEVSGYTLLATDGEAGQVEDFLVSDDEWTIRYLVIDTGEWLQGRRVLIAAQWVTGFALTQQALRVDLTRESIKNSPQYDPAIQVSRGYEEQLYDYYNRPKYWLYL